MHELSIAESVVGIARGHAAGRRVASVQLRIGQLRQVVPTSLEFAFELLSDGTELEGAELEIEVVPAAGICRACGAETALTPFPLSCARCEGIDVEVTAGEELVVDSLELAELEELEDRLTQTGGRRYGD